MVDADVHVIDDAVADPGALRSEALSMPYRRPDERHPWFISTRPSTHARSILLTIGSIVGHELHDTDPGPVVATAQRYNLFEDAAGDLISIHSDPYLGAGILYLSPDPPAGTGTSFYRHRESGRDRRVRDPDDADLRSPTPIGTSYDLSAYELIDTVENRYNRLVVFDATRFHAAGGFFGTDALTARLTLTFFWNTGRSYR